MLLYIKTNDQVSINSSKSRIKAFDLMEFDIQPSLCILLVNTLFLPKYTSIILSTKNDAKYFLFHYLILFWDIATILCSKDTRAFFYSHHLLYELKWFGVVVVSNHSLRWCSRRIKRTTKWIAEI